MEFGAIVGALIGLGAGGEEGAEAGAEIGAAMGEDDHILPSDIWYVDDVLPVGTAAAVALIEHRWALPLRDKIRGAGGFHIADAWVHPLDLVAIGLASAEEAEQVGLTDREVLPGDRHHWCLGLGAGIAGSSTGDSEIVSESHRTHGLGEPVVKAAAAIVDQDRQEAQAERQRRQQQADEPQHRLANPDPLALGGDHADRHQAVPGRLTGQRPEDHEVQAEPEKPHRPPASACRALSVSSPPSSFASRSIAPPVERRDHVGREQIDQQRHRARDDARIAHRYGRGLTVASVMRPPPDGACAGTRHGRFARRSHRRRTCACAPRPRRRRRGRRSDARAPPAARANG